MAIKGNVQSDRTNRIKSELKAALLLNDRKFLSKGSQMDKFPIKSNIGIKWYKVFIGQRLNGKSPN